MQDVIIGLDKEGNHLEGTEDLKFQGKANLLEYLKNNQDLFNKIYKQVNEKLGE